MPARGLQSNDAENMATLSTVVSLKWQRYFNANCIHFALSGSEF